MEKSLQKNQFCIIPTFKNVINTKRFLCPDCVHIFKTRQYFICHVSNYLIIITYTILKIYIIKSTPDCFVEIYNTVSIKYDHIMHFKCSSINTFIFSQWARPWNFSPWPKVWHQFEAGANIYQFKLHFKFKQFSSNVVFPPRTFSTLPESL